MSVVLPAVCGICGRDLATEAEVREHMGPCFASRERKCIEPGCAAFPDATWYRCDEHQTAYEARERE